MQTYIVMIIALGNEHWFSVKLLLAYEPNFNEFSFYVFNFHGHVIFLGFKIKKKVIYLQNFYFLFMFPYQHKI